MDNNSRIISFGLEVKRRRLALGLSQEQLADICSIHRTYIGGIERGERNPTLRLLLKLSTGLKCPLSNLFVVDGT